MPPSLQQLQLCNCQACRVSSRQATHLLACLSVFNPNGQGIMFRMEQRHPKVSLSAESPRDAPHRSLSPRSVSHTPHYSLPCPPPFPPLPFSLLTRIANCHSVFCPGLFFRQRRKRNSVPVRRHGVGRRRHPDGAQDRQDGGREDAPPQQEVRTVCVCVCRSQER